jgi:steroid 5-alpha reductase family enzyme
MIANREDEQQAAEMRIANGIYGVIVSTAVMASARGDSVHRLAVAVLVTLLVYWSAERYAHIMARRTVLGPDVRWRDMRGGLKQGWELVTASFTPLLVLVAADLVGASYFTSVLLALLTGTGLLVLAGWRVGTAAGLTLLPRFLSAAGAGAFGVVMIGLKTLLH